jgi:hypothetical protein
MTARRHCAVFLEETVPHISPYNSMDVKLLCIADGM